MAVSLADADAMIAACQQAGVKLGICFQRRVEPPFGRIKAALEAGQLGRLTLGVVTMPYFRGPAYYNQAAWRGTWAVDGGGVLMNQGIHLVDLLLWYMGHPVGVQAVAGTLERDIEVEDTLAAALHFEGGAMATITATTTAAPGFAHRLELYGTQGAIQIEGDAVRQWTPPGGPPIAGPAAAAAGAGSDPRGINAAGHTAIFADFIEAVRTNRSPLIDGVEGRRSLAAVLAVYRAAGLLPPEGDA